MHKGQVTHGTLFPNESSRTFVELVGALQINLCLTEIENSYAIISRDNCSFQVDDICITPGDQPNTLTIAICLGEKRTPEKNGPESCTGPQVA
jgi:hypothetical protein